MQLAPEGLLWLLRFLIGAGIFGLLYKILLEQKDRTDWKERLEQNQNWKEKLRQRQDHDFKRILSKNALQSMLVGGIAFLFCSRFFGHGMFALLSLRGFLAFLYIGTLFAVAWIDRDRKIIDNGFSFLILLFGAVALWLFPEHGLYDRLLGLIVIALPMLLLTVAVGGAFGGGDIKLIAASGFFLGWRAMLPAMCLSLIIGAVYSIYGILCGKLNRKSRVAFAPFLAIGLVFGLFFGDVLMGG